MLIICCWLLPFSSGDIEYVVRSADGKRARGFRFVFLRDFGPFLVMRYGLSLINYMCILVFLIDSLLGSIYKLIDIFYDPAHLNKY